MGCKMKKKLRVTAVFAAIVLIAAILMAIWPSLFTKYDPLAVDPLHRLQGLSAGHICGTDEYGRDIWTRIVYGTRNSLTVGFGAAGLAMILGVVYGTCSSLFLAAPLAFLTLGRRIKENDAPVAEVGKK